MVSVETRKALSARISQYTYRKTNLLEKPITLFFNPLQNRIIIDNYLHDDRTRLDGECFELSIALNEWMKQENIDLDTLFCGGSDTRYFKRDHDSHVFLLAGTDDALAVFRKGASAQRNERRAAEREVLVLDPSFHVVDTYARSGYTARVIHDRIATIPGNTARTVDTDIGVPLGMGANGVLMSYVPAIRGDRVYPTVGLTYPGKPYDWYNPKGPEVRAALTGDSELARILDVCLAAPAMRVDEPLPDTSPRGSGVSPTGSAKTERTSRS